MRETEPVGVFDRLRELCLSLPEVQERLSHGEPCFFIRGKKTFVMCDTDHHGSGHLGFWCPAAPGVQEELIAQDAVRFFRPPYVGPRGWLGVRLAGYGIPEPDWREVDEVVRDAYRQIAPATLVAELDRSAPGASAPTA